MLQHKLKLYVAAPKGVTDRFCFICPSESSRTPKKAEVRSGEWGIYLAKVGITVNEVILVSSSLGCAHGALPFTYLGLPVDGQMHLSGGWQGIIKRFHDRLSSWNAMSLSFGERLTLIKSVHAINSIESMDLNFKNSFAHKVADGATAFFWSVLNDKFPRLYETEKDCKVKKDRWKGLPCFPTMDAINGFGLTMLLEALRKINVMLWKASLNRLATRPNLIARGVTDVFQKL
ncbi:hypothetical protein Tco_0698756 [Tanacetum coccineum]